MEGAYLRRKKPMGRGGGGAGRGGGVRREEVQEGQCRAIRRFRSVNLLDASYWLLDLLLAVLFTVSLVIVITLFIYLVASMG